MICKLNHLLSITDLDLLIAASLNHCDELAAFNLLGNLMMVNVKKLGKSTLELIRDLVCTEKLHFQKLYAVLVLVSSCQLFLDDDIVNERLDHLLGHSSWTIRVKAAEILHNRGFCFNYPIEILSANKLHGVLMIPSVAKAITNDQIKELKDRWRCCPPLVNFLHNFTFSSSDSIEPL